MTSANFYTTTIYADYDDGGRARQITVSLPRDATTDEMSAIVRMLAKAGMPPAPGGDPSLTQTRIIVQPRPENDPLDPTTRIDQLPTWSGAGQ